MNHGDLPLFGGAPAHRRAARDVGVHAAGVDLRFGRWEDVLADVVRVDATIVDPPYGARTHEGWNAGEEQVRDATGQATRSALSYQHWAPDDVAVFVDAWAPRTRGWFCAMTSHDLVMAYSDRLEHHGRYVFAPIPIIQKRPRLLGDGPASWTAYMVVARPRTIEFSRWGCLPGAYFGNTARDGVTGGKPVGIVGPIVRDYSLPGDLVCDQCFGGGTTPLVCDQNGRRFVGSEVDPEAYAIARRRCSAGVTPDLFAGEAR